MKFFDSEVELGKAVVEYIRDDGWDVYQEVQVNYGGCVADLVAIRAGILWIIELKMSLTFSVLAQAMAWSRTAHIVSVGVPFAPHSKGRKLAVSICQEKGIGLIEARTLRSAIETVKPRINRAKFMAHLAERFKSKLSDKQKTFAPAGNSFGKRFTPFANTCLQLREIVEAKPGITLRQAIEKTRHHYASSQSARCALSKWIAVGKVPGIRIEKDGRELKLYVEPCR